ncbi:MAG: hypothetical protein ACI8RD_003855 [Bacillariaceae sp.]|jgi:hypothetical protein
MPSLLLIDVYFLLNLIYLIWRDQDGWGGGHTRNIIITIQGQG